MASSANQTFSIVAAVGIFLLLLKRGFAILCGKITNQKNVINIMLKNILDTLSGAIGLWSVGNAAGIFDNTSIFFLPSVPLAAVATSLTIAITLDTVTKRFKSYAYVCYFMVIPLVYSASTCNVEWNIWSSSGFLTGGQVAVASIWSSSGFLTTNAQSLSEYGKGNIIMVLVSVDH